MPRGMIRARISPSPSSSSRQEGLSGVNATRGYWEGPVEYWLVATAPEGEPGINGAIARRDPREGTRNTISVASADETLGMVVGAGGKALGPKMAVPGVGYHALCEDPEGNVFGIMELDPAGEMDPGDGPGE